MEEWPMSKFMLKNANGKPGHKIKANELEDQQNWQLELKKHKFNTEKRKGY